jgi:SAM-dependent methyltransferase
MNPREYRALFEVEDRHWWFVGLRREVAAELARARISFTRWLDAGSGTGGLLANLRPPGSPAAFGAEVSSDGLAFSQSRGLSRLARASVGELPFASGAFDLVTSIDVLCHRDVDEPRALAEAHRCLREGGILLLQVPAFDFLRGEHDEAVWTNRRYRKTEVEHLLSAAGFRLRRSFYRNSILFPAAAVRRLIRRRRPAGREALSDVAAAPRALNSLFAALLELERCSRGIGWSLPFGLSVFCLAEKPEAPVPR